ncbi:ABC transporter ATP-binding protein [Cucumibacter marinus]|uniref:ABC transporter ATP-binding protein n=1 Tax=Cucumibacter marinus TaxID=1121252 RepID=UPI000412DC25|nr:ATP-binding cassette domain-containing protein [Cucumibacter marinus]
MIETEGLTVRFGSVRPIDGLTARIDAPVAGLIGPNGAGKTTLLNVISGFVRPESGSVTIDGKSFVGLSPVERVRGGLRRSFQTEQVVEDLTVVQNVQAIADHLALGSSARSSVAQALQYTGLESVRDELGGSLNLFQRRLVEIAKCLVGEPKLVLLDEPGAGLSNEEGEQLQRIILGIPEQFRAQVLVIDHDVDLIRAMCEQTLVLDYGKMLALGPTAQVLESDSVRQAYLGEL